MIQLTYRTAQPADARLYFDWANDPDTRRQSFNQAPISLETHTGWFTRQLADPNTLMLVFEDETSQPVGQVRFERTPVADMPAEIIIGISIDAGQRGKSLAAQLIRQGCAVCRDRWGAVAIHAYIKPGNEASARAFARAGFQLSGESGKFVDSATNQPGLLYINSQ